MFIYSKLSISICIVISLFVFIDKVYPKPKASTVKKAKKLIETKDSEAKASTKSKPGPQDTKLSHKGIGAIKLGLSMSLIKESLSKIQHIKSLSLPTFYKQEDRLKGKSFEDEFILIKQGRVYYKKLAYVSLVSNDEAKSFSKEALKVIFPTNRIRQSLIKLDLRFYNLLLYESVFHIRADINSMNSFLEEAHRVFGDNFIYSDITKSYTWLKLESEQRYKIRFSLRGTVFPRVIKISFINLGSKDIMGTYLQDARSSISTVLE